jgi:Rps23 Pro-64 3,4-dihydroxylase Tpa1-like proline 4-hydroxylase
MQFNKDAKLVQLPFPHAVIDSFLPQDQVASILKALKEEEFEHKESDLFSFFQSQDFETSDQKTLQEVRDFFSSEDFVSWVELLTNKKLKRGVVDLHATIYTDTDYLLCHDDQLDSRRIAFLYYLSDMKKGEGGELVLWDETFENSVSIRPKVNRLAFFVVSDKSFHEVAEVLTNTQRIAIGGWLHDQ